MAIDQSLVPSSEVPASNTDGMELVDLLGNGQELRYGSEGLPTKIHVRSSDDHPDTSVSKSVCYPYHTRVQELSLVDGYNLGPREYGLGNVDRVGDREGLGPVAIVGNYRKDAPISVVQVRFEHLDFAFGDESPAYPT